MGEPLRVRSIDAEAEAHDQARLEAEAAVADVMVNEEAKAKVRAANEVRLRGGKRDLRKPLLLLTLCAFNAYIWFADPAWLKFDVPRAPTYDYYVNGWKMAVAMQAERIETYRASKGLAPPSPREAGQPVRGVSYQRRGASDYQLAAGEGSARITYDSSADSVARPSLRGVLTRITGPAGSVR